MPVFTIITICMNEEQTVDTTIRSVLSQTYHNYEYIIKDGRSKDRTVDVAQSYSTAFYKKGIPYRIISQNDNGIYDAMNQALAEAHGEWVIFMNAGDLFADDSVLMSVSESPCLSKADIVYGDAIDKLGDMFLLARAKPFDEQHFWMVFCHQSTFTRRVLFDQALYSTNYRICSDYQFYLHRFQEGKKFCHIPLVVSIYDRSGISSNAKQRTLEMIDILEHNSIQDEIAIQSLKNSLKNIQHQEFMHRLFWRYIPEALRAKRRLRNMRKSGWKTAEEMFGTSDI